MRNSPESSDSRRIGFSAMRRLNGAFLLDLLRQNGPISRAELARLSGLTKPTVSSQITRLFERGIAMEDGIAVPDTRGGKPSKLLRFNPSLGNLVAIEVSAAEVRLRLADLDGTTLDTSVAPIHPEQGASHILETAVRAMNRMLMREAGRREKLMVAAVAAPGRIDTGSGVVIEAGNVFDWKHVSVREPFERAFGVPVLVENDVNFATLGEMHFGFGRGIQNFIFIRLTTGIAAGLVLDGNLYRGTHGTAGEIAHMVFDRETAAGALDPRGFLEAAIGRDRLQERIQAVKSLTVATASSGTDGGQELMQAIRAGDPIAATIANDLESNLTLAVANIAAVADPELIILAGDLFHLVADKIQSAVAHIIPWPVRIEVSALGDEAVLLGAIGAAQDLAHDLLCETSSQTV
ncbi:MAG: ROK family transcriptional regulator [Bryobacterales bacterium]|nr:ROK family transcriptional regulator [Bryobacterales bacterium]